MKWKLHRRSYLAGILMGVCLGTGVGYICAVLQSVHSLGTDQEGEVVLGIAALRKLETNDVTGAQHVLQWIVAENYLDHIEKRDPWWLQAAYRNSKVVERVERAAKDIPGLAAAIQERKKKKSDQSSPRE
jgi:hypothetical protein